MTIKQWTRLFKALSNENRLKIIKLLSRRSEMSVSDISEKIEISFKATSKNLIQLANVDILESNGKHAQVFYKMNPSVARKIADIIRKL